MSEFTLRPEATLSPTKCLTCNTTGGPFVDTHIDLPGYGHVWLCASNGKRPGCVRQMARLDGMFDPQERDTMLDEQLILQTRIERLEGLVKRKTVLLSEIMDVMNLEVR